MSFNIETSGTRTITRRMGPPQRVVALMKGTRITRLFTSDPRAEVEVFRINGTATQDVAIAEATEGLTDVL